MKAACVPVLMGCNGARSSIVIAPFDIDLTVDSHPADTSHDHGAAARRTQDYFVMPGSLHRNGDTTTGHASSSRIGHRSERDASPAAGRAIC
jgi:hypothetical protein